MKCTEQTSWAGGMDLRSSQTPVSSFADSCDWLWVALSPTDPSPSLLGISTAGIISQGSIDYPQNLLLLLTIMGGKIVPLNYSEWKHTQKKSIRHIWYERQIKTGSKRELEAASMTYKEEGSLEIKEKCFCFLKRCYSLQSFSKLMEAALGLPGQVVPYNRCNCTWDASSVISPS